MSNKITELSKANFDAEVLQPEMPVLVDFWAPWCMPCRMVGPVVEQLADDYAGKVKVCKLNIDDHQEIAARFQVMSIPTLMIFKNGKLVDKTVGAMPKRAYVNLLDAHL
ncbi:MAG: thioredoxin [Bacillota bacterium]